MLRVVSVSLGSARRDGRAEVRLGGERLLLQRIGVDGDWRRAASLLRELDGRVAAVGLGGVNDAYRVGDRPYRVPLAARLRECLRRTPCADGTGWKRWAEPLFLERLAAAGRLPAGGAAVVTSVLDRWWLAEALAAAGFLVRAGDPWFALGIPWLPGLPSFRRAATVSLPLLRLVPVGWVYPHADPPAPRRGGGPVPAAGLPPRPGAVPRRARRLGGVRPRGRVLWAGDVRLLLRRLPSLLPGDRVLAAHAGAEEAALLAARGVEAVTLNPVVNGFSPAANLWEAAALALAWAGSPRPAADGPPRAAAPAPSLLRAVAEEVTPLLVEGAPLPSRGRMPVSPPPSRPPAS